MGASSDIMHDFALMEIKHLFSSYDSWTLKSRNEGPDYDTVYMLDRFTGGHREIVRILATYKKEITPGMLDGLVTREKSSDGTIPRYQFAVMAPVNADISLIPEKIRVYTMQSFAFDGDSLTWVKKPVCKTPIPVIKQAT